MKTPLRSLLLLVVAWGLVVAAVSASHRLDKAPPAAPAVAVAVLTAVFATLILRPGTLHEGLRAASRRALVAFNVFRVIGLYFVWLQAQGRLPVEFAEPAGWGDVAVAAGAAVLFFVPERTATRALFMVWNLLGIADLVVAVGTATWLNYARPGAMAEMLGLPLALVPLWLVPLYLATHLYLLTPPAGARRPSVVGTAAGTPKAA
jgi:hypothetical protein